MSVTTSVVKDVLFTQFMTELFGSVTCIGESCDWHVIPYHVTSHVIHCLNDSNNLVHIQDYLYKMHFIKWSFSIFQQPLIFALLFL